MTLPWIHLRRMSPTSIFSQLQAHQVRPFFTFLKSWETVVATVRGNQHCKPCLDSPLSSSLGLKAEQERRDDTNHRMSLQHAHPLGPWQAILNVVRTHHDSWLLQRQQLHLNKNSDDGTNNNPFLILDLACGPRGQPGTTIAHALPTTSVHCTDSCPIAIAAVLVDSDLAAATTKTLELDTNNNNKFPQPAPKNLSKSVHDLGDLSEYGSNTVHVIVCCYGYSLSDDVSMALAEAHRVLVQGGILVICTWERSALLLQGNRTIAWARQGNDQSSYHHLAGDEGSCSSSDDAAFLVREEVPVLALSGEGEFEGLLVGAGFDHPGAVVTTFGTYPFDLGRQTDHQFDMGTLLIQEELENLGAFHPESSGGGGHWKNLAEEAFWINIGKYTDMVDGNMMLRDNTFKLTTSTKKY